MAKTIIQKLLEELNIHNPLRTYLESGSSEFNRTDYEEKIQTLAKIISNGYDLNKVIKQYRSNYSLDGYKHVYNNVIPTLKGFISYLNTGKPIDLRTFTTLEDASDEEVVKLLTETIEKKS